MVDAMPLVMEMTAKESFRLMLARAGIVMTYGAPFLEPEWCAITFDCGPGIAGSRAGLVTAVFKPDGSLDGFMFCD